MGTPINPRSLARPLVGYVVGLFGEEGAQDALIRLVDELFELEPGVRQHLSDLVIGELKEEIGKDDTSYAYGVIRLIEEVEDEWRNERG